MKRKRILLVDDNAVFLDALSMRLSAEGYDVLTAQDGASAVSTVRGQRPDLVLLDLFFPPDVGHGGGVAWDGLLILQWLRRIDEAKDTPVLIMTGTDLEQDLDRAWALGAIGFLKKPFSHEDLMIAVGEVFTEPATPA
jgi:two-component system OmpR family response regulator